MKFTGEKKKVCLTLLQFTLHGQSTSKTSKCVSNCLHLAFSTDPTSIHTTSLSHWTTSGLLQVSHSNHHTLCNPGPTSSQRDPSQTGMIMSLPSCLKPLSAFTCSFLSKSPCLTYKILQSLAPAYLSTAGCTPLPLLSLIQTSVP